MELSLAVPLPVQTVMTKRVGKGSSSLLIIPTKKGTAPAADDNVLDPRIICFLAFTDTYCRKQCAQIRQLCSVPYFLNIQHNQQGASSCKFQALLYVS